MSTRAAQANRAIQQIRGLGAEWPGRMDGVEAQARAVVGTAARNAGNRAEGGAPLPGDVLAVVTMALFEARSSGLTYDLELRQSLEQLARLLISGRGPVPEVPGDPSSSETLNLGGFTSDGRPVPRPS